MSIVDEIEIPFEEDKVDIESLREIIFIKIKETRFNSWLMILILKFKLMIILINLKIILNGLIDLEMLLITKTKYGAVV